MHAISNLVVDLVSATRGGRDAKEVGLLFLRGLEAYGATALNARGYQSARDLSASGEVFARFAPANFMPVYGEQRFYTDNPLPFEAHRRSRPFLWSDLTWAGPKARWVRETMRDCGCPDGIFVPCHGPGGYMGAVSVAFERIGDIGPADRSAIALASLTIHERMKELARPNADPLPVLTAKERDCLSFISDGLTDAEIALAMRVTPSTVAFHVTNARRKLGARTRAQAVARFVRYLS